jgi:hypothetical protein
MSSDDAITLPTLYAVELTITADAAAFGRVRLHVALHGKQPVTVALPERPDQIEWFDPDAKALLSPVLRVAWSAWRIDRSGLALDSRASTALRASNVVTLAPGAPHDLVVDLGVALAGLDDARSFAGGWCARAWLVGAPHPLPSNIVCWTAG